MNKGHREMHEKMGKHKGRDREMKKMSGGGVASKYPHSKVDGDKQQHTDGYGSCAMVDRILRADEPITHIGTMKHAHKVTMEGLNAGGKPKHCMKSTDGKHYAAGGVGKLRHDAYYK